MMAMAMRGCFLLSLQLVLSFAFAKTSNSWSRAAWNVRCGATTTLDDDNHELLPEPVPSVELPPVWASHPIKRAILFMDKFTSYFGYYMSQRAREAYGVACINVLSSYMIGYFLKEHAGLMEPLSMAMPVKQQLDKWKAQLPVDEIAGIICESDSGLADAERLGVLLGLQNHDGVNEARRNKYLMIEQVGKAGLAVVQQKLCYSFEEAVEFARELGVAEQDEADENVSDSTTHHHHDDNIDDTEASNTGNLGRATNVHYHSTESCMCIVKPVRGAATDSVFLCKHQTDVKNAFNMILGMPIFDDPRRMHDSVLIQEFAVGTEYAIDVVSKDGQHKVAALWRYDKRPANGASFVYFATEVIDADTDVGRLICEYVKNALDALDIKWGQTHSEVVIQGKEPRLVEVNCRQHNMDFAPLTMACIGYNSLDMTLAAFLGGNPDDTYPPDTKDLRLDWDSLPDLPVTRAYGAVVHLVNFADGILLSVNEEALFEIEAMESVLDMEIYPSFLEIGAPLLPTIDIRTDAGWVQMINDDKEAFQRDYERIVELMPQIFIVDPR